MANGRLGKANVLAKGTTAVYTNSSGAEASVSVVAQATGGSQFHLRIDDSTNATTNVTAIVTEAYDARYIEYAVSNTLLTDTASPAYVSKYMFTNTAVQNHINQRFEAFGNATNTTYTLANSTANYRACSDMPMPYDTWKDIWGTKTYAFFPGGSGSYQMYRYEIATAITTADAYYNLAMTVSTTGNSSLGGNTTLYSSYSTGGVVMDYWSTDFPYIVGMQGNGYMTAVAIDIAAGNGDNNNPSGSWINASGITGNVNLPSSNASYQNLLASNKVVVASTANRYLLMNTFYEDTFTSDITDSTRAVRLTNDSQRRVFKWDTTYTRTGGHAVYFEYNPADGLHYMAYMGEVGSTKKMYLVTVNLATAQAQFTSTGSNEVTIGLEASNSAYGVTDITSEVSLTLASPYAFTDDQVTFRSVFIGTQASPLWALTVSEFSQTTAAHVYYSTDLKKWTRSTDYFTNDYNRLVNQTTVVSASGAVTASKSNINSLGVDGVLEVATDFSHYSQSGLVLSNGDRIVTYNSGATPVSIQVMGFEGG